MNGLPKYFKEEYIIPALLALAFLIRICCYSSFSYSNDELSAIYRATYDTFGELVSKGFFVDGHPGGIQVWLFYWMKLFGSGEASVRLPFVFAGVGAVLMSFLVAKRWFNKASGFYTASMVALLQFPVLFSQIARPYSAGLFFTLWMCYAWTRVLFPLKPKTTLIRLTDILMYGVTFALAMYTHYFSFLVGLILAGTGLFYLQKKQRTDYIISLILAGALFIPHIRITLNHLSLQGVGQWLAKPGYDWLWLHIRYIFNDSWFVLIISMIVVIILILTNRKHIKFTRFHYISGILFLLPFLIGFCYSLLINPVLQNSVLIFSFPFLLIFLFSFANPGYNRINTVLLIFLNICLLLDITIINSYYKKQHFGEFKGVAEFIDQWNRHAGSDQIKQVVVVNNPWYLDFYLKKMDYHGQFDMTDIREGKDLAELRKILNESSTPYFLYAWTKPDLPEAEELIHEKYPYLIQYKNFSNLSRAVVYGKKCFTGLCEPEKIIYSAVNNFDEPDVLEADQTMLSAENFYSPPASVFINEKHEFGPAWQINASEIHKYKANTMVVSCKAFVLNDSTESKLIISIDKPDGTNRYWLSSDFKWFTDKEKWSSVIKSITIPEDMSDQDIVKVYTWNPGLEKLYIDDYVIKFYNRVYK